MKEIAHLQYQEKHIKKKKTEEQETFRVYVKETLKLLWEL